MNYQMSKKWYIFDVFLISAINTYVHCSIKNQYISERREKFKDFEAYSNIYKWASCKGLNEPESIIESLWVRDRAKVLEAKKVKF